MSALRFRPRFEPLDDRLVPASLSVGDATVAEGNDGTRYAGVVVRLDAPANKTVTVNYSTADGTATAGSDYARVSGQLTFAKGEKVKTISIPIQGDRVPEADEFFSVRLAGANGAKIADGFGSVAIADDEPRVSVSDVSRLEGNAGAIPFAFAVYLDRAYDLPVTVTYATADGSATAGSDYAAASGTLTFAPGQTWQTVDVLVGGDRRHERDEVFFVRVSSPDGYAPVTGGEGRGYVVDDEPLISINDAWYYGEGTSLTFTVSLRVAHDEAVTVDFATADGTAVAGVDYVAAAGTLTFAPGETTKTITIEILDPASAPDKYLSVRLSGASANALIGDEVGAGVWWGYDDGSSYYDGGIAP